MEIWACRVKECMFSAAFCHELPTKDTVKLVEHFLADPNFAYIHTGFSGAGALTHNASFTLLCNLQGDVLLRALRFIDTLLQRDVDQKVPETRHAKFLS